MKNVHYDLSFLDAGQTWPPKEDFERLKNYKYQQEQFELTAEDQMKKALPDGLLDIQDYQSFIFSSKILGYPRLMTLKLVDMIIGQPPIISAQNEDEKSEQIKSVRADCSLNTALKQALIDYSRFGVFLVRVFKDERNKPAITSWNPSEWFPVFYADGTNRVRHNVIAWRFKNELTAQIHNTVDGSYEQRVIAIGDDNILKEVKSSTIANKESGKQLLFAVTNTPTSTNPFGTNDYEIINGLLQKAIQRLCAILRVLDEHSEPSMYGPTTLLTLNDKKEKVFYTNKYYAISKDEDPPNYLTWDGKLEASFKAFELICKQIYVLSEMGEALLGVAEGGGNVVSGTAMRFKLISPLEKSRRVENELTEPLKDIMSSLMYLAGNELDAVKTSVAWKDSLPKDPAETAELARKESGSAAVKPLVHALMDNYDLDKDTAKHYYEEILKDLKNFGEAMGDDLKEDGRTSTPSKVDPRKKGSPLNPATSENRGEDSKV